MSIWTGLKTAEVFQQGNYFDVGIYDVRITRCLVKQTQRSGVGFIAELEVLTSTSAKHPPGSTGSWFQGLTKNPATALSAIKEFVIAIHKLDPKRDTDRIKVEIEPSIEQWMDAAIGPGNIFAGRCIHLETFVKKTREKQTDFTVHRWSPFEGPEPTHATPAPSQQWAPNPVQPQAPPQQPPPGYQMQNPYAAPPPQYAPPPPPPGNVYDFRNPGAGGYPTAPPYAPPPMPPQQPQQPRPAPGMPPTPIWDSATQAWRMP